MPTPSDATRGSEATLRGRAWIPVVVAGLFAGLISWSAGETIAGRFEPPLRSSQGPPTAEDRQADSAGQGSGQLREATLTYGVQAAILGLALGLAGGGVVRRHREAIRAAVVGAIVGGIAVAATTMGVVPIASRVYNPDTNDLLVGFATHATIAAIVGLVAGLAFGLGLGERRAGLLRFMMGGMVGAIAGATCYEIVGAALLPLDATTRPVAATWMARLVSQIAVPTFAAIGTTIAQGFTKGATTKIANPASSL